MEAIASGFHPGRTFLVLAIIAWITGLSWHTGCSPTVAPTEEVSNSNVDASEPPAERNSNDYRFVGHRCKAKSDCPDNLGCETLIPDGYCTKECKRSADCPGDSLCVRITFSNGQKFLRCVHTCRSADDCRDQFVCYRPPNSRSQLCLPTQ